MVIVFSAAESLGPQCLEMGSQLIIQVPVGPPSNDVKYIYIIYTPNLGFEIVVL